MSAAGIAARIVMHFERQTRWLEQASQELHALQDFLEGEEALSNALAREEALNRELETLLKEQSLLLREWQQALDISQQQRREVRERAEAVQVLVHQMQQEHVALLSHIQDAMEKQGLELSQLRKGRTMMRGYSPGADPGQGYLDSKG